ncbi:MAG: hypothetical protein AB8G05_15590 [Oligoflexales bacterium]
MRRSSPAPNHTNLEQSKAELDSEAESLCLNAKQLGNSSDIRNIHDDFQNLSKNLDELDCGLFLEFVHSNEFDALFSKEMKKIGTATSTATDNKGISLVENPDESTETPGPTLANPELVPRLLLTMGLFGYVSAARIKYVQKLGKLAFFQFAISTVSLYLSFRTGTKTQTELENESIPWVLFLNGVMGAVGSTTIIKKGYSNLRKWEISPNSGKSLSYEQFRKEYSTLNTSDVNSRQLKKLDDVAITRFAEKHNFDPKVVKGATSAAIIGIGSIMAAFAIRQLTAGVEELRKSYKLVDANKPQNFEEIFEPGLKRLLLLKFRLKAQMNK